MPKSLEKKAIKTISFIVKNRIKMRNENLDNHFRLFVVNKSKLIRLYARNNTQHESLIVEKSQFVPQILSGGFCCLNESCVPLWGNNRIMPMRAQCVSSSYSKKRYIYRAN